MMRPLSHGDRNDEDYEAEVVDKGRRSYSENARARENKDHATTTCGNVWVVGDPGRQYEKTNISCPKVEPSTHDAVEAAGVTTFSA